MAHEIETRAGKAMMAYAGELPWHGLGKKVPDDLDTDQFLKAAGLNWEVEKVPGMYEWKGELRSMGQQVLIRTDDGKRLSTVSDDWEPLQNREAFDFFTKFVQHGHMTMETAGSLKEGQIIWAMAKIKDKNFKVFKGDEIESYLLLTNPHRYGSSIDIRYTPTRVVCNNTLTLALQEKGELTVKMDHRKKFDPEIVYKALNLSQMKLDKYKTIAEYLGKKKYTKEDVVSYFKEVFPNMAKDKNKFSRAAEIGLNILETQPGAEFAKGTWWQPFNAATFIMDHLLGRSPEAMLHSAWYGNRRGIKIKALDKAMEYADAA